MGPCLVGGEGGRQRRERPQLHLRGEDAEVIPELLGEGVARGDLLHTRVSRQSIIHPHAPPRLLPALFVLFFSHRLPSVCFSPPLSHHQRMKHRIYDKTRVHTAYAPQL